MTGEPAQWPSAADYVAAVQDPERCLLDSRIREAEFQLNLMGIPSVQSGQVAAVFPARIGGEKFAIRMFTAPTEHSTRYKLISEYLTSSSNPYLVEAEWIDEAVAFGTGVFPAVVMPWVSGETLSSFIDSALEDDDSFRIRHLADRWVVAALSLATSGLIHGDLQHGNILVDSDLSIRLIDYDSTWVPGLSESLIEVGHPNYQHPERMESGQVLTTIDVFPSYVIYVSLRAISADPSLWDKFHNGENLLFVQSDYTAAGRQGASIWESLLENPDPAVVLMSRSLQTLCQVKLSSLPPLEQLFKDGDAAIDHSQRYVTERAGRASAGAWWDVTDMDLIDEAVAPDPHEPDNNGAFDNPDTGGTGSGAQWSAAGMADGGDLQKGGGDRRLRVVATVIIAVSLILLAFAILAGPW